MFFFSEKLCFPKPLYNIWSSYVISLDITRATYRCAMIKIDLHLFLSKHSTSSHHVPTLPAGIMILTILNLTHWGCFHANYHFSANWLLRRFLNFFLYISMCKCEPTSWLHPTSGESYFHYVMILSLKLQFFLASWFMRRC